MWKTVVTDDREERSRKPSPGVRRRQFSLLPRIEYCSYRAITRGGPHSAELNERKEGGHTDLEFFPAPRFALVPRRLLCSIYLIEWKFCK